MLTDLNVERISIQMFVLLRVALALLDVLDDIVFRVSRKYRVEVFQITSNVCLGHKFDSLEDTTVATQVSLLK